MLKYASVCSGIEAPTVAWHSLGWEPQWFSQYDPEHDYDKKGLDFPSRVLQYHYPKVENLGDMMNLRNHKIYNERLIQLLVGGTPCQSFSVAGFRKGLADERGNLALEFVRILDEKRPPWFVWENVPGVLSSGNHEESFQFPAESSKDFANILSAFTGQDVTGSQTIPKAGIIEGTFYSVAWRILDSQYFGVPQRRRRIFVVGYLGNDWRPPAAVLFERDSLRGDFAPRKKAREATSGNTSPSVGDTSGKGFRMTDFGGYVEDGTSSTMKKRDFKDATDLVVAGFRNAGFADNQQTQEAGTLKKSGGDLGGGSENIIVGFNQDAGNSFHAHDNKTNPLMTTTREAVAYGIKATAIDRKPENGGNGLGISVQKADTLTKMDRHGVCYNSPLILKIRGGKEGGGKGYLGDTKLSFTITTLQDQNLLAPVTFDSVHDTLTKNSNQTTGMATNFSCHPHNMVVRRLTPLECERLQGFPDGYTDIPGATDSTRYAALGNSMTTNVMHWIGNRINEVHNILNSLNK